MRSCASNSIGVATKVAHIAAAQSGYDLMKDSLKQRKTRPGSSEAVDVDDRLRESLRRFLRQIVPDAACYGPMRILP